MNEKRDDPVLPTTQHQVPDWEPAAAGANGSVKRPIGEMLRSKLDTVVPPNRKYLGMRRRIFLLGLIAVVISLIALIVGLSVGLTVGSGGNEAENLPLPTNTQTWSGELTFYNPSMGSCGIPSSDNDKVVAVSLKIWDQVAKKYQITNPNENPLCGLKIRARRFYAQEGGERSVDVTVVDRCVGCTKTDLDMSPGAFDEIAASGDGRVDVTWAWLDTIPDGAQDK
ncbi:RlpA-like double-psi beta-barrel-protein domain-containing protein-containing protein [Phyllosticta paracitricarpa]|uniref:RlpA-like double-psi beta-barrel-protein domain-containing protein-containing protein n=1 Tax=Phyllosticta paracitricarpa TaxID=2016321 RepID=A0ABR1N5P4_9PEZI